ncbi:MAG: DNA gyrase subunit A [Patescibacteria group bacterium]
MDTKIRLSDGRNISFGDLIEEDKKGKKNYTFTSDVDGKIKIALIQKPHLTINNAKIMKVVLDNGEEIKCTLNHKFLLKNGEYIEAENLKSGMSLMPLYTRLSNKEDSDISEMSGYEMIFHPNNNKWEFTHRLADDYNLSNNIYTKFSGKVRHHTDMISLRHENNPEYQAMMHEKIIKGNKNHTKNITGKKKFDAICKEVLMSGVELSEMAYENKRTNLYPYGSATLWNTGVSKYYNGDINRIKAELVANHKIRKTIFLKQRENVYDLTINDTHNFALSAGVFVHNSIDGDGAAAMRYTEAKMSRLAMELLRDLEKETVDFRPNYDNTKKEPIVLPSAVPNLLLNGTLGIAVGMATNIPPHNLSEVLDATLHLIENPDAPTEDLLKYIKGPDFPTGGIIYSERDIQHAYSTGRGGILVRGEAEIVENKSGQFQIIITSIPYRVVKADLIMTIADLVREKKIEGIRGLRDESAKDIRVVIDLKSGAHPQKILNFLYKHTQIEDTFHLNVVALVKGVPETLSLKSILEHFIEHRVEVVKRRSIYDLKVAEAREHILIGLKKALDHIDEIIKLIKKSRDVEDAKATLMKTFKFSVLQTQAILDMRLQKLAGLERKKIEDELTAIQKLIKELKELLASSKKILDVIKTELIEIKTKYGDLRRTKVIKHGAKVLSDEDLIPDVESVLVLTQGGYVKRTAPDEYRRQKRGGVGVIDLDTKEEDFVTNLLTASTHSDILFFTDKGKAYQIKMYELPEGKRATKGKALVNFISLADDEKVTSILPMPKESKQMAELSLMMVTKLGTAKKVKAASFHDVRRSGLIAITLESGDSLMSVSFVSKGDDVSIVTSEGQSIRFRESDVREMGRGAYGVRGIALAKGDAVISADVIKALGKGTRIIVISKNGYGKTTLASEYKTQKRGGSGILTMKVTDKTGPVISAKVITEEDSELVAMSKKSQVVRVELSEIPTLGRQTQGVRVMKLREGDSLASVVCL